MGQPQKQRADHGKETAPKTRRSGPVNQGPEALLEGPEILALQRALADPTIATAADTLALQKTYGNQSTQSILVDRMHAVGYQPPEVLGKERGANGMDYRTRRVEAQRTLQRAILGWKRREQESASESIEWADGALRPPPFISGTVRRSINPYHDVRRFNNDALARSLFQRSAPQGRAGAKTKDTGHRKITSHRSVFGMMYRNARVQGSVDRAGSNREGGDIQRRLVVVLEPDDDTIVRSTKDYAEAAGVAAEQIKRASVAWWKRNRIPEGARTWDKVNNDYARLGTHEELDFFGHGTLAKAHWFGLKGPEVAKVFGGYSPGSLSGHLRGNGLAPEYAGQITLKGCYTSLGGEESYAAKLGYLLSQAGYQHLPTIRGFPGAATTTGEREEGLAREGEREEEALEKEWKPDRQRQANVMKQLGGRLTKLLSGAEPENTQERALLEELIALGGKLETYRSGKRRIREEHGFSIV